MIYVFDLDGTIADSAHVWERVDREILEAHGAYSDDVDLSRMAAMDYDELYHHLCSIGIVYTDVGALRAETDRRAVYHYANSVGMIEGADGVVRRCSAKGKTVLFTDSPQKLYEPFLTRHRLYGYFNRCICSRDAGLDKKATSSYRALAEMLGASVGDMIFFDDSPACLDAARSAGIYTIGICGLYQHTDYAVYERSCDKIIHGWDEV